MHGIFQTVVITFAQNKLGRSNVISKVAGARPQERLNCLLRISHFIATARFSRSSSGFRMSTITYLPTTFMFSSSITSITFS